MNWFVYQIAAGHTYFIGIAMLLIGLFLASLFLASESKSLFRRLSVLTVLMAAIAIAISSTTVPWWMYILAAIAALFWLASRGNKSTARKAGYLCAAVCLLAAAIEVPFHIMPHIENAEANTLMVVGDSVTAGMGANDSSIKWPNLISERHSVDVDDRSHVGETAGSALKRIRDRPIDAAVVLVEIGGNDLMGSTSAEKFAEDLAALLEHVASDGRQVIMFELPLPPFRNAFGRIQRSLADRYSVKLIPKRIFLSILADPQSTVDSVHLTQFGHERMADTVWRFLKPAFD